MATAVLRALSIERRMLTTSLDYSTLLVSWLLANGGKTEHALDAPVPLYTLYVSIRLTSPCRLSVMSDGISRYTFAFRR